MSLLVDMMTNTLDESYADAARRRTSAAPAPDAPPAPPTPLARRLTALLLLLALGVVTGVAAAQVRRRDAAQDRGRQALVEDVVARTAATDALADEAARLQVSVAERRAQALQADAAGRGVSARLGLVELVAGTTAVSGDGVEVVLDDAESPESQDLQERGGDLAAGRVQDRDLQELVNGLWAAGAEAISINDQRLTALTAIRSAGESVLVDKKPLSPPYVVRAIGDPQTLEPRFVDSPAGRRLATYTSLYGLRLRVSAARDLRLPASREPELRRAVPEGTQR
jgi:uncharacterized protein YlxW (UPF0749 family)